MHNHFSLRTKHRYSVLDWLRYIYSSNYNLITSITKQWEHTISRYNQFKSIANIDYPLNIIKQITPFHKSFYKTTLQLQHQVNTQDDRREHVPR